MNGRRLDHALDPYFYSPGDYGRWQGNWYARTPNGHIANLRLHDVVEHSDGTITVSPSIRVTAQDGAWHGYIEKGIWREA